MKHPSRHHVIPKSRLRGKPPIALIERADHELYHKMFGNFIPEEIIEWLVVYYWNGDWSYVLKALERRAR